MKLYPLFQTFFTQTFLIILTGFLVFCNNQPTRVESHDKSLATLDFTREYDSVETWLEEIADNIEVILHGNHTRVHF